MKLALRLAIAAAVLLGIGASTVYFLHPGMLPSTGVPLLPNASTQVIARGEYLARAGDCVACHTSAGGPEFAGLRAMPTPFGNLYVPNITPDEETGIGA